MLEGPTVSQHVESVVQCSRHALGVNRTTVSFDAVALLQSSGARPVALLSRICALAALCGRFLLRCEEVSSRAWPVAHCTRHLTRIMIIPSLKSPFFGPRCCMHDLPCEVCQDVVAFCEKESLRI